MEKRCILQHRKSERGQPPRRRAKDQNKQIPTQTMILLRVTIQMGLIRMSSMVAMTKPLHGHFLQAKTKLWSRSKSWEAQRKMAGGGGLRLKQMSKTSVSGSRQISKSKNRMM